MLAAFLERQRDEPKGEEVAETNQEARKDVGTKDMTDFPDLSSLIDEDLNSLGPNLTANRLTAPSVLDPLLGAAPATMSRDAETYKPGKSRSGETAKPKRRKKKKSKDNPDDGLAAIHGLVKARFPGRPKSVLPKNDFEGERGRRRLLSKTSMSLRATMKRCCRSDFRQSG